MRETTLAGQIYDDFGNDQTNIRKLPSFSELAARYGVSKTTVQRAVALLCEQCLVVKKAPRTLFVINRSADKDPVGPQSISPSVQKVYDCIEAMCLSGRLESGASLPKIAYFTQQSHVSRPVVVEALRRLSNNGIIHKRGRSWIAGKLASDTRAASRDIIASYRADPAEVLIIALKINQYHALTKVDSCKPFFDTLYRQLQMNSVQYRICFVEKTPAHFNVVSGREEMLASIGESLDTYRGAVLAGRPVFTDIAFIRKLLEFDRPVMAFDHLHEICPVVLSKLKRERNFLRISRETRKAAALVIKHLVDHGHRRIGVPLFPRKRQTEWEEAWMNPRVDIVNKAAGECDPHPTVHTAVLDKPFYEIKLYSDFLHKPVVRGAMPRECARQIDYMTPALEELIYRHKVTALIALNDLLARDYFVWCCHKGIRIPEDMSIVSFENNSFAEALGLTSVHFGLDTAALRASPFFYAGRGEAVRGEISSVPWLMVRSSSGPVAQGRGIHRDARSKSASSCRPSAAR